MYLAHVDEYKQKFQYFISFPKCQAVTKDLDLQMKALLGDYLGEHTSHSIDVGDEKVYGWAFFAIQDPDNDVDASLPCEEAYVEAELFSKVKDFIMDRIKDLMMHDIEYGPAHDRTLDRDFYPGIKIHENIEVDCFYFYDNPKWYE
jgi:hypothetical protein